VKFFLPKRELSRQLTMGPGTLLSELQVEADESFVIL
jgi:hypothetical protein